MTNNTLVVISAFENIFIKKLLIPLTFLVGSCGSAKKETHEYQQVKDSHAVMVLNQFRTAVSSEINETWVGENQLKVEVDDDTLHLEFLDWADSVPNKMTLVYVDKYYDIIETTDLIGGVMNLRSSLYSYEENR